jgi:ribonuclease R
MSTERQLTDIKKTRLMKDQVGSTQEGTIVTITNFGIFIELENFTQGLTRFDKMEMDEVINTNGQKVKLIKGDKVKKYRLGQKVNVKIVDLDISRGLMDFEIQDESNS